MATTYNLYLKNRKKLNDEYPVYLRITNARRHRYLTTGISVKRKEWNPEKQEVRRSHPNHKTLNQLLQGKIKAARKAELALLQSGKVTAKSIRQRMKLAGDADYFKIGDKLLHELAKAGKHNTHKHLQYALGKLAEFEGARVLPLKRVDGDYFTDFIEHCKTAYGNNNSTISKDLGQLRKVVTEALKTNLITKNPFEEFTMPSRTRAKVKVKLSYPQIQAIEALELAPDSLEYHIRNAFIFSFYSGGIRFGDICCLTWNNVQDGRLSYQMNKNEKVFSTALNDHQRQILALYEGTGDDFIFPFLNNHKDYTDERALRRDIGTRNAQANGKSRKGAETGLKLIAKLAGIDENVSFHVSRHSFAQYAITERKLTVYEVMQAMRHSDIKTTMAYLKSLDEELADEVMDKIFSSEGSND